MCTRKTSLSLLLFFVSIIYFTIRKVNPLCEKNVLFPGLSSQNHASWPCYVYHHLFAAGRPSRVGPYAQGRWPCFLRIAELWQPTFISSPVCDIVGDAQRAYRYEDSAKCCAEKTLFVGPGRGVFYELRVTRSDVVSLSLLPRSGIRRGRPVKASRYALRVSRIVVVTAPGCDEPTSRCQTSPSIWTLGRDKPVIPRVAFIR